MRISRAAKNLRTLISFSSARISKNAFGSSPYGETITYGELAQEAGTPKAARAVGVAVGDNPFSIIVPCHRVIGKDKSLTGYGGGFDVKKYLLAHELGTDIENLPFSDCSRRIVG